MIEDNIKIKLMSTTEEAEQQKNINELIAQNKK